MNQQAIAIIIAGALIAGAIALTNHWELVSPGILRLNRWTGTVVWCDQGRDEPPVTINCGAHYHDLARRMAANFAKLPEMLRRPPISEA